MALFSVQHCIAAAGEGGDPEAVPRRDGIAKTLVAFAIITFSLTRQERGCQPTACRFRGRVY